MSRVSDVGDADARNVGVVVILVALSIILHLFQIPFPPASYLLFDACGIPIAIAMFFDAKTTIVAGIPAFYIGLLLYRPQDPIGPFMKIVAELSTSYPLYLLYHKGWFKGRFKPLLASTVVVFSRTIVMNVLNILIDPFYFILFHWFNSYDQALAFTIASLPFISVFNIIVAIYVTWITIPVVRELERIGVLPIGKGIKG
ncbi:ECF transporter S component [Thermogladius sp. 4427co]|uniref:ECF transporter S component n=1 Tax=Thermogladius sp. 4427co TaxID=3450718 RepID=UPI003F79FD17